jgi:hypothetical protein
MKKFLNKILIFSVLFFAFDKIFILVRNYAPQLEVDKRLEIILQGKMDADLLIFGSSVGARDIIASLISKELNTKAYNLSYPGSNIDFHEYLLRQLLENKNKKPRTILLTVDEPNQLIENKSINFRLERLYPLLKYEQVRKELVKREDKNSILAQLFVLYLFNKSNFDLRKKHFTIHDTLQACGSMPVYATTKNFPTHFEQNSNYYDKSKESEYLLNKFNSFVNLCNSNNIKLIIVYPPKFRAKNISFEHRFKSITEQKALHYSYDDHKIEYQDQSYYNDASHLRMNGAILFSYDIINYLKLIKNN